MRLPPRTLAMCIVNPDLVGGLAQLVGSQVEVMGRLGISWNTWVKIRDGQPILMSVGRRLRTRILGNAEMVVKFSREFPSAIDADINRVPLEAAFLQAVESDCRAPGMRGRSPGFSGNGANTPPTLETDP